MLPGTEPGLAARRGQSPSDPVFTALSARWGHYRVPTLREDTVPEPCPQLARSSEIQTDAESLGGPRGQARDTDTGRVGRRGHTHLVMNASSRGARALGK